MENASERLITVQSHTVSRWKNESLNPMYLALRTYFFLFLLSHNTCPIVLGPVLRLGSTKITFLISQGQLGFIPECGAHRESSGQDTQILFLPSLYAWLSRNLGYHSYLAGLSYNYSRSIREFNLVRIFLNCAAFPSKPPAQYLFCKRHSLTRYINEKIQTIYGLV